MDTLSIDELNQWIAAVEWCIDESILRDGYSFGVDGFLAQHMFLNAQLDRRVVPVVIEDVSKISANVLEAAAIQFKGCDDPWPLPVGEPDDFSELLLESLRLRAERRPDHDPRNNPRSAESL